MARKLFLVPKAPIAVECSECEATSEMVARVRAEWKCWKCGLQYSPPANDNARVRVRDPERDLENLERWMSVIEGLAQNPKSDEKPPKSASGRKRRKNQLPVQAVWEITWMKKPAHDNGLHSEVLEQCFEGISDAVQTARRIECLLDSEIGQRHAIVLMLTYLMTGLEVRNRWRASHGLGFWVGYLCASEAQRAAWMCHATPWMRTAFCRAAGDSLLADARRAYQALPVDAGRAVHGRSRIYFSSVRQQLGLVIERAWREIYLLDDGQECVEARTQAA